MQRGALDSVVYLLIWIVLLTGRCSASVCGIKDQVTARSGVYELIVFPYYSPDYSVNQTCSWKITTANDNEVVRLIVVILELEGGDGCPNDSLSIYDADGPVHNQRLAKLCGSGHGSKTFISTGRYMYIRLVTSGDLYSKRVNLHYTAVKRAGAPRSTTPLALTAEELRHVKARLYHFYTLKSPSYPASYSSNENILWNIVCDPGHVVQLHVMEMDLQNSSPCGENRVTVYDSDKTTVLAVMCNYQFQGFDFYSTGDGLYVHFTSGLASTGKGFSVAYQAVRPYDAKPWTTRSLRSTTTTRPSSSRKRGLNDVIFIIVGLVVLLILTCITGLLCRRCCTRPSRPRVGRPEASTLSSAAGSSTTRPSNTSVYIASRPSTTPRRTVRFTTPPDSPRPFTIPRPPVTAHTNLAFSAYGEDPPPYSSLQLTHQPSQPMSAASLLRTVQLEIEPRPPPYSESMIVTYPPSYKEVTDDAAGQ